jgi:hypothetical protein
MDKGTIMGFDLRSTILTAGAEPQKSSPAAVNIRSLQQSAKKNESRVRILVPDDYLVMSTRGGTRGDLYNIGGIIFPYTPSITYDVRADYATVNPVHSNYTQYFYKYSAAGAINITGKFTVQNEQDAINYVSTVHLLKSLTKMRFGSDSDAGAPPPVCRLYAYGKYVMDSIPISIATYKIDMPAEVDYFTLGKNPNSPNTTYGQTSVPISATISITCNPMYSRDEMQKFSVTDWLSNYQGVYL